MLNQLCSLIRISRKFRNLFLLTFQLEKSSGPASVVFIIHDTKWCSKRCSAVGRIRTCALLRTQSHSLSYHCHVCWDVHEIISQSIGISQWFQKISDVVGRIRTCAGRPQLISSPSPNHSATTTLVIKCRGKKALNSVKNRNLSNTTAKSEKQKWCSVLEKSQSQAQTNSCGELGTVLILLHGYRVAWIMFLGAGQIKFPEHPE